jgi:hypothetical protein
MIVLVDGLVSHLALVIITGAPDVRWGLGSPEDSHHHLHHHAVLIGHGHQVFAPTLPMGGMRRLRRAPDALPVDAPSWHADELERWLITWMKANSPFIR